VLKIFHSARFFLLFFFAWLPLAASTRNGLRFLQDNGIAFEGSLCSGFEERLNKNDDAGNKRRYFGNMYGTDILA